MPSSPKAKSKRLGSSKLMAALQGAVLAATVEEGPARRAAGVDGGARPSAALQRVDTHLDALIHDAVPSRKAG